MRLLAIDPGTRVIGWGVLDILDGRIVMPSCGCGILKTNQSAIPARIYDLWKQLSAIRMKWKPDACAIEVAFLYQNIQTTMRLAEARGACFIVMAGLPIEQHDNNKVKKILTGRGNATKQQVGARVKKILGIPQSAAIPEDALDALGIGIYHAKVQRSKQSKLFDANKFI